MKIEVEVLEMEKGYPTVLKYEAKIYVRQDSTEEQKPEEEKETETEEKTEIEQETKQDQQPRRPGFDNFKNPPYSFRRQQ